MNSSQRGILSAAGVGFVVVMLDVSVVNVALDALRSHFATDVTGLQWVINAYTLAFASLLLTAGALGDRFGARRMFAAGLVTFTMASIACGMAGSMALLVVARAVQGAGAALLVPNSLAMLRQVFPDSRQRSHAVGWWGAAGGIALAAGPVLGGLLVTHVGWRSIFLVNLPIGIAGVWLAFRHASPRVAAVGRGVDLPGQMTAILALVALTIGVAEAARLGWQHPLVATAMLLSVIAAFIFIRIELHSAEPMLPPALFRNATFSSASAAGVIVNFAYYGMIFVFSLFFQVQQRMSAQQTGLAFLPMTVVLMAANIVASRLHNQIGAKKLMIAGLTIAASGYLLLLPVSAGGSYRMLVVPMLIAASGIAIVVPTMTNITLSSVDASRSGVASGVLNSARQIGGMLGVAVFGFFVRDTHPAAFMRGMHLSIMTATALLLLGCVMCMRGIATDAPERIASNCRISGSGR